MKVKDDAELYICNIWRGHALNHIFPHSLGRGNIKTATSLSANGPTRKFLILAAAVLAVRKKTFLKSLSTSIVLKRVRFHYLVIILHTSIFILGQGWDSRCYWFLFSSRVRRSCRNTSSTHKRCFFFLFLSWG